MIGNDLPRFVFSVLHAESKDSLKLSIDNFRLFSHEKDVLIVNSSSQDSDIFDVEIDEKDDVILLRGSARKAFGHTLLQGHIENWRKAYELFASEEQDFLFITMASNSLFFRAYNKTEVLNSMFVETKTFPLSKCGGQYNAVKNIESFVNVFGKETKHIQIEGFCAWGIGWKSIEKKFVEIDFPSHNITGNIAMEEVLPMPVLIKEKQPSTNIGRVKWGSKKNGLAFVTPREIFVEQIDNNKQHVCLWKWFRRDSSALTSAAVSNDNLYKAFHNFYSHSVIQDSSRIEQLSLARVFLDQVIVPRTRLTFGSYSGFYKVNTDFDNKKIMLDPSTTNSPYLYFEQIHKNICADLNIDINEGVISIDSNTPNFSEARKNYTIMNHKSYVTLYVPIPDDIKELWLSDWSFDGNRNPNNINSNLLLNFASLNLNNTYKELVPSENSFKSSLLKPFSMYDLREFFCVKNAYFGIPIPSNCKFSVTIFIN